MKFARGKNMRVLFAAVFLVFLLAEWGSHGIICSAVSDSDARSVSATEYDHEDPCQTLLVCSDGKRKDHQQKLGHDALQHYALLDGLSKFDLPNIANGEQKLDFVASVRIYGHSKPPFHPPKNS